MPLEGLSERFDSFIFNNMLDAINEAERNDQFMQLRNVYSLSIDAPINHFGKESRVTSFILEIESAANDLKLYSALAAYKAGLADSFRILSELSKLGIPIENLYCKEATNNGQ